MRATPIQINSSTGFYLPALSPCPDHRINANDDDFSPPTATPDIGQFRYTTAQFRTVKVHKKNITKQKQQSTPA